jgi:putative transposase
VVVCEELRIANMSRRPKPRQDESGASLPNGAKAKSGLNKSILDAAWGLFVEMLRYKAEARGKQVIAVPPQYTSQRCSACGDIVKKSLSHRTHRCDCGFVAHRHHNAALNILRLGLESLEALSS